MSTRGNFDVWSIREKVSLASRILGRADQGDFIWGHASARDPGGRGVWVKASGWGVGEITPERVHLVSFEGVLLDGDGSVHLEYPIHTEIMAAMPEVGGVVHVHSPYSVALAAAGQELRPVSHAATFFGDVPIPRFVQTSDLIQSPELGRALAACLGVSRAVFLVNHGIVTTGPDLESATVAALILEQAAYHQFLVSGFGGTPTWTRGKEVLDKQAHIYNPRAVRAVWDHLLRQLDDPAPSGLRVDAALA